MPINPCGYIVDFNRRAYDTKARFFNDSPSEVTIRWYPALPEAKCLPFPSKWNSLDWDSAPYERGPLGEVWDTPRTNNFTIPIPLTGKGHFCGTEHDFRHGVSITNPQQPVGYDPGTGLPLCCGIRITIACLTQISFSGPGATTANLTLNGRGLAGFLDWIFRNTGLVSGGIYVHLYVNFVDPPDPEISDFVEASYPGYAPIRLTPAMWQPAFNDPFTQGIALMDSVYPPEQVVFSASSGSQTIFGLYLTLGVADQCLGSASLSALQVISPGNPLLLIPLTGLGQSPF